MLFSVSVATTIPVGFGGTEDDFLVLHYDEELLLEKRAFFARMRRGDGVGLFANLACNEADSVLRYLA